MRQSAAIWINNNLTEKFKINKSTRQGCPLLPLLFVLVLEVLLRKIQQDDQIPGIKIKKITLKTEHLLMILVVVVFFENPKENLLKLLKVIEEFSQHAVFYINKTKSKLMFKNIWEEQKEIINLVHCQMAPKIKDLGIDVTERNIDF